MDAIPYRLHEISTLFNTQILFNKETLQGTISGGFLHKYPYGDHWNENNNSASVHTDYNSGDVDDCNY